MRRPNLELPSDDDEANENEESRDISDQDDSIEDYMEDNGDEEAIESISTDEENTELRSNPWVESSSDAEIDPIEVEVVAEAIQDQVSELKENWHAWDRDQRLQKIQDLETTIAKAQNRPVASIGDITEPSNYGETNIDEALRNQNYTYSVNSDLLDSDDVNEVVSTVIHEGKHIDQANEVVITTPEELVSNGRVRFIVENVSDYKEPTDDIEAYEDQFVEQEAESFANEVLNHAEINTVAPQESQSPFSGSPVTSAPGGSGENNA